MRALAFGFLLLGAASAGAFAGECLRGGGAPPRVEDDPAFRALEAQNRELRLQLDAARRALVRVPLGRGAGGAGGAAGGDPDRIPPQDLPVPTRRGE